MILGITGGMGCGKSTAARLFETAGFRRLDSDALIRERVLTSPAIRDALRARYGAGVFGRNADGAESVDRAALAARVFAAEGELRWLEGITHPALFALWREAFASAPDARWVVEVPLLFEHALENWFDFTLCVACSPAQQLVRLEQRGISRELAVQRISKQLPLVRKIELSDFVLWNEGSPEFLQAEVQRLADSFA